MACITPPDTIGVQELGPLGPCGPGAVLSTPEGPLGPLGPTIFPTSSQRLLRAFHIYKSPAVGPVATIHPSPALAPLGKSATVCTVPNKFADVAELPCGPIRPCGPVGPVGPTSPAMP